jgi:hypothetical protein
MSRHQSIQITERLHLPRAPIALYTATTPRFDRLLKDIYFEARDYRLVGYAAHYWTSEFACRYL